MLSSSGQSIRAFAKSKNLDESLIRRWKKAEAALRAGKSASRRLPGGGRKSFFPQLEARLYNWVHERNKKGLKVKCKYIIARAIEIKKELIAEMRVGTPNLDNLLSLKSFSASSSWCTRFRQRFDLVLRRQTTCKTLPEDFANIAVSFIRSVQQIIADHDIKPKNIVNFDQVPRYFEVESSTTITSKGLREVLTKKASTSHKRFTVTPVISADGKFLALHVLFSNLKNKPAVDERCLVDVNKTGMWNSAVIKRIVDDVIIKKCQSVFMEPTLILLDSYGTHLKFVDENQDRYERRNVFFSVIPPRLTGLLQPLDVAVNRSFQQYYVDQYNEHINQSISDVSKQTKAGNISMPKYSEVSKWVADWSEIFPKESVVKAFTLCGLVSSQDFGVEKLHKPLAECFAEDFEHEV